MASEFPFDHSADFTPERAQEILRGVPERPGVFALRGTRDTDAPYLTRTANLRRRMARLLTPPETIKTLDAEGKPVLSKRLNLREKVARIAWCVTGSEFESLLVLYHATASQFGHAEARRRLKLHTPYFLRLTMDNRHPRVYTTNRLSRRGLAQMYGPFPSRLAAERYCDAALDLFKLRRCHEDLEVSPTHPGCAYGEMKKCMAPCNLGCTHDEYAAESLRVKAFFDTRGESLLAEVEAQRERASAAMEFERAAALHEQWLKVKAAASEADELVRPVPELRAVIVQPAADRQEDGHPAALDAAIFLLQAGCMAGPERLSTLGVRAVKEQTSVGSSLFAQPLMLQAVPLEGEPAASLGSPPESPATSPATSPEDRARAVLAQLEAGTGPGAGAPREVKDLALLSDHLSLLRRWYYRPAKQRTGELFLPNPDGSWPLRRILRAAARMALGEPTAMAETQRDAVEAAAKTIQTRILHEGRPDVERVIAVAPKRTPARPRKPSPHTPR